LTRQSSHSPAIAKNDSKQAFDADEAQLLIEFLDVNASKIVFHKLCSPVRKLVIRHDGLNTTIAPFLILRDCCGQPPTQAGSGDAVVCWFDPRELPPFDNC
jgi:hypothetical protein